MENGSPDVIEIDRSESREEIVLKSAKSLIAAIDNPPNIDETEEWIIECQRNSPSRRLVRKVTMPEQEWTPMNKTDGNHLKFCSVDVAVQFIETLLLSRPSFVYSKSRIKNTVTGRIIAIKIPLSDSEHIGLCFLDDKYEKDILIQNVATQKDAFIEMFKKATAEKRAQSADKTNA